MASRRSVLLEEGEYDKRGQDGDDVSGPSDHHAVSYQHESEYEEQTDNCQMSPIHSSNDEESLLKQVNMDIHNVECGDSETSELPFNQCCSETEGECGESFHEQQVEGKPLPDVMFECQLCKVLFGNKDSLKNHVEYEHGDHPFVKETLEKLDTNDTAYQIATKPTEEKPTVSGDAPIRKRRRKINRRVSCLYPGCGKVFQTAGALKTHSVCHEIMKECIHCGAVFGTATALIRHIDRRHNPRNLVQLPCTYPECNEVFRHQTVLDKHLARHARVVKTCSHCDRSFRLKRQLNEHIKQVHSTDPESNQLMCQNCGIPMADKESLLKHMQTTCVLSDGIVCQFDGCGEMFYSRQSLQNHRRRHLKSESETDPNQSWHTCPNLACGQRFLSRKKLKIHLRISQHDINVDEFPFVCLFKSCVKRYVSKQDVIAHMKAEHWGNKKRRAAMAKKEKASKMPKRQPSVASYVKCPVCHKRFSSDTMMRYHVKTKHAIQSMDDSCDINEQEQMLDKNDTEAISGNQNDLDNPSKFYVFDLKMYRCPVCHSSYHTVGRLKVHIESQHQNLGEEQAVMLQKLDKDQESFIDVVKTTLPRDCQYTSNKPRVRNRKKKIIAGKNQPTDLEQELSTQNSLSETGSARGTVSKSEAKISSSKSAEREGESEVLDPEKQNTSDSVGDESEPDHEKSQDSSSPKKSPQKYDGMYFCRYPSCSEQFTCKAHLVQHQKTHTRNLKCSHFGCNAEFFSMVNLRGHIKLVHGNGDVSTCKQCGRVGKGKSFKKHMDECKETTPLFVCPECGKAFPRKSSYKNHLGVHKEKSDKHWKRCSYEGCTKKFKSNQDLSRHLNVHTGARPHACPYGGCNKTYKQRPHLLVHLKTHSVRDEGKNKETFPCEYCGFPFKHKCGKLKHLRNSCVKGPNKEMIIERISRRRRKMSSTSQESDTNGAKVDSS